MEKVLLIDGNNILHRAYHGLPPLKTADGRYTNAVYGFLKMLHKVMEQEQPDYVAVCFDKGKATFRHRRFAEYKAQRKPTDPELAEQFPLIREVLALNGFRCLESDEYEADDLMGTLAARAAAEGKEAVIFSGDKDLLQVLGDGITIVSGKKQLTDLKKTTAADFKAAYGMEPIRLIDLKGLMGDASDNYPGVKGVGEKTALKLLSAYGTLENLYDHIEELPKNKMREKLVSDRDNAFLSKELAAIVTDAPLDCPWETLIPAEKEYERLLALYRDLEFRGYVEELKREGPPSAAEVGGLFASVAEERPFEITVVDPAAFTGAARIGVFIDGDTLYAADEQNRAAAFSLREHEAEIAALLGDASVAKVCSGLKALCRYCLAAGISPKNIVDDTEIMAYLDEAGTATYQPNALISRYLKTNTFLFENEKAFAESRMLLDLAPVLRERLEEKDCLKLYLEVELPLAPVLADMEHQGIRVDRETLDEMSRELGAVLDTLIRDIYALAGEEFNLNSPKQLSVILFEKLDLPKGKKTKTGYSTNNEVLEHLRGFHPIIEKILSYRTLSKLKSTYTDVLPKLVSPETGRIHTKFLQTVTTTGRLSSADPNLQNIPVRGEEGRLIRRAFVASDAEHVLLAADYSQIELRLLAHFSDDPVLISAFTEGEDIHARTAGEIFGVPLSEVTADMRRAAKTVNFGLIYGMSSYSLAGDIGVSRKEAQSYIDSYFARYPRVKSYLDQTVADAREKGYAETLMGRRRHLPDIKSRNFNLRSFAERTAMNTPLQGSAADIIKAVMVKLHDVLEAERRGSKMILQVHDELILDCPISELAEMKALLKDVMEHTVSLRVPLTVDMKTGKDWYHMEKE
ncbi:MAG: DNA polymerase I [Bacillota bacterium]|jgi:DNA polymerase-1